MSRFEIKNRDLSTDANRITITCLFLLPTNDEPEASDKHGRQRRMEFSSLDFSDRERDQQGIGSTANDNTRSET
jgi:hypothetical protein